MDYKLVDKPLVHLVFIALLGLLAYSNTFNAPFQWDENHYIVNNPIVHDIDYFGNPSKAKGLELYDAFRNRYVGYLTFALNYRINGTDVRGYHIINVALHIASAFLVYFLALLSFRTPFMEGSSLSDRAKYAALYSGLLFVAHPAQIEAVTYVFQRLASLAAFFYLLSVVSYIGSRLSTDKKKRYGLYALSLSAAVIAAKTKENAFTLPLAIALYEILFFKHGKRRLLYIGPFLLTMLIVPFTVARPHGEIMPVIGAVAGQGVSWKVYLLTEIRTVATYMRLLAFPVNQNLLYDATVFHSLNAEVALSFILLLSIAVFSIYLIVCSGNGERWYRVAGFGILWFFLALSVESGIIRLGMTITEYRLYLPSAGAFISISAAALGVAGKLRGNGKRAALAMFCALPLLLASASYDRNGLWSSRIALWEDTAKKSPGIALAHSSLGSAYMDAGMTEKAIVELRAALSLNSLEHDNLAGTHYSLGLAYGSLLRHTEALEHFKEVVELRPDFYSARMNLGSAYAATGSHDEAIRQYLEALKLNPASGEALSNIGVSYRMKGMDEEAIEYFEAALSAKPDASVYNELGITLALMGEDENAEAHFRQAIALDPSLAKAHYNLGLVYFNRGDIEKARKEIAEALKANPGHEKARRFYEKLMRTGTD